jgi:hypothetical protein
MNEFKQDIPFACIIPGYFFGCIHRLPGECGKFFFKPTWFYPGHFQQHVIPVEKKIYSLSPIDSMHRIMKLNLLSMVEIYSMKAVPDKAFGVRCIQMQKAYMYQSV